MVSRVVSSGGAERRSVDRLSGPGCLPQDEVLLDSYSKKNIMATMKHICRSSQFRQQISGGAFRPI